MFGIRVYMGDLLVYARENSIHLPISIYNRAIEQ